MQVTFKADGRLSSGQRPTPPAAADTAPEAGRTGTGASFAAAGRESLGGARVMPRIASKNVHAMPRQPSVDGPWARPPQGRWEGHACGELSQNGWRVRGAC